MANKDLRRKVVEELGEAVRRERAALRLSQQDVAKEAKVSPARVVEIESGAANPRLETLVKVTRVLGLRITVEAA